MESERCGKVVGCLSAFAKLEVVAEQFLVHRVCAVVDDALGSLHGIESADVGNSLLGDDDVDGVFGVVNMRAHRHDVAYQASLGDRGA